MKRVALAVAIATLVLAAIAWRLEPSAAAGKHCGCLAGKDQGAAARTATRTADNPDPRAAGTEPVRRGAENLRRAIDELRRAREKHVSSKPQKKEAPATEAVVLLPRLTAQWAAAKHMEETGRREADVKKKEILEAGAEIGYADDSLVIGHTTKVEGVSMLSIVENPKLAKVLRDEGCLEDATMSCVALGKVQALAKLNPKVAAALERASSEGPRFEQAAKKKGA